MCSDAALDSGKRVSNTWVTYPEEEHSFEKSEVIFHNPFFLEWKEGKGGLSFGCYRLWSDPWPIRLLVR